MDIHYSTDAGEVDWPAVKALLRADRFDNGRTPEELRTSFDNSHACVFAWDDAQVVGTVRLLADGICNAFLVDAWTASAYRRRGIGTEMVRRLLQAVPGHHVALFTSDRVDFYESIGFSREDVGMSTVVRPWLRRSPAT